MLANLSSFESYREAYARMKNTSSACPPRFFWDFYGLHSGVFMYNYVISKSTSCTSLFTQVNEVHSHGTRSMNKIYVNNFIKPVSGFSSVLEGISYGIR